MNIGLYVEITYPVISYAETFWELCSLDNGNRFYSEWNILFSSKRALRLFKYILLSKPKDCFYFMATSDSLSKPSLCLISLFHPPHKTTAAATTTKPKDLLNQFDTRCQQTEVTNAVTETTACLFIQSNYFFHSTYSQRWSINWGWKV